MTDFVEQQLRPELFNPPVRSVLDGDFYEPLMRRYAYEYLPDVEVVMQVINRHKHIPVAEIIDEKELRGALDHIRTLTCPETDTSWLRGQQVYGAGRLFPDEFLAHMEKDTLCPYTLARNGDQYDLRFTGPAPTSFPWESTGMAAMSELYFRSLMRRMNRSELEILYARAKNRLWETLQKIKAHPTISISEFGTRRRHSFLWQKFVLGMCKEVLGAQFSGISNTYLAFKYSAVPKGTNAHKLPMVEVALANSPDEMRQAQYLVYERWAKLYPPPLLILLTDAFGSKQFFAGAPEWLARASRGARGDSGDLFEYGDMLIAWYLSYGVDPKQKLYVPSDGLDADMIIRLHQYFEGRIQMSYGWGTGLTNDFADLHPTPDKCVPGLAPLTWRELFKAFSNVCKPISANGRGCAKISDTAGKGTGDPTALALNISVFGAGDGVENAIIV